MTQRSADEESIIRRVPQWQQGDVRKGMEVIDTLSHVANGGSSGAAALGMLVALKTEHRFLQSGIIQTLFRLLASMDDTGTDDRNQWAIDQCKKLSAEYGYLRVTIPTQKEEE